MGGTGSRNPNPKPRRVGGSQELAREVAGLCMLDVATLRDTWRELFGATPSPHLGRSLMMRALAYRLQERALGGLKPSVQRILERIADSGSGIDPERIPNGRPSAGTVLLREWRGVSHRVTVQDHGVVYRGRHHRSLSEVARVITGTRWSGPLFFGLKRRAKEVADG